MTWSHLENIVKQSSENANEIQTQVFSLTTMKVIDLKTYEDWKRREVKQLFVQSKGETGMVWVIHLLYHKELQWQNNVNDHMKCYSLKKFGFRILYNLYHHLTMFWATFQVIFSQNVLKAKATWKDKTLNSTQGGRSVTSITLRSPGSIRSAFVFPGAVCSFENVALPRWRKASLSNSVGLLSSGFLMIFLFVCLPGPNWWTAWNERKLKLLHIEMYSLGKHTYTVWKLLKKYILTWIKTNHPIWWLCI